MVGGAMCAKKLVRLGSGEKLAEGLYGRHGINMWYCGWVGCGHVCAVRACLAPSLQMVRCQFCCPLMFWVARSLVPSHDMCSIYHRSACAALIRICCVQAVGVKFCLMGPHWVVLAFRRVTGT